MTKHLPFPTQLVEKYRPKRVSDFVGVPKPKRILETFIKNPFSSAWLFNGQRGTGKTTMGLAITREINAELHHIPSRKCDMENVELVTRMCHSGAFNFFGANKGEACEWHVILVDEVEAMTLAAQHLFLSKLDSTDAPPNTIFIFTCNTTEGLEDRFLSRCRKIDFTRESLEGELERLMRAIYRKEGGKHPVDFASIAKSSNYDAREAITRLETELMIGTNRKGLPSEEIRIIKSHEHDCKKCHKPFKCINPLCELPFRTVCSACGGAATIGSMRARKAIDTIRRRAVEEARKKKK